MTRDQDAIDERIQAYYGVQFDESVRLTTRSAQGPLEFQRTQELIRRHVPTGRVLDIGGGSGIHAKALPDAGYEVELIDSVARHVRSAGESGLVARVADARDLPYEADSFDAALLLGPLYHLATLQDRLTTLREAARVVRPGGVVLAAGLSRYIAFGNVSLAKDSIPSPISSEWAALITEGTPGPGLRFPAGHFHTAEGLKSECEAAGLDVIDVVGVEGPAGLFLEVAGAVSDEIRDAALVLARAASSVPGIRDQSAHLLAISAVH